jgi:hypothetical protein
MSKDLTEITGSFDITNCLPTNSDTTTALSSGTGDMWSHPVTSLLQDPYLTQGYYGGGKAIQFTEGIYSSYINYGSDLGLDNIHDAAFTAEGWFFPLSGTNSSLIGKTSWFAATSEFAQGALWFQVSCATSNAGGYQSGIVPTYLRTSQWHHWAMTFDDAGDRKVRIFIDGILIHTSSAGVGAIVSDASYDLKSGSGSTPYAFYVPRGLGWTRISNNIRYTTDFIPSRTPPTPDANTLAQWNMTEGSGTTLDNVGTLGAVADGTITDGTWVNCWTDEGTPTDAVSVAFNGTNTSINAGSEASVDNLADNAFTAEGWVRGDGVGGGTVGTFLTKRAGPVAGWNLSYNGNAISTTVYCATTSADIYLPIIPDKKWHHWSITFDDAGDRKLRLFVDGILVITSSAGVGAIASDSANDLFIGNNYNAGRAWNGALGWLRISNSIRYTANFIPLARNAPPANDANTVRLFKMDEGLGTTITDYSTNAQNATLSNGTWNRVRSMDVDSPGARTYMAGHIISANAANEGEKQVITAVNLCPNGTFDTSTGWSLPANVSITGGVLRFNSPTQYSQATSVSVPTLTPSKRYYTRFTISNYVSGGVRLQLGNNGNGLQKSADGTYEEIILSSSADSYIMFQTMTNNFVGDIDNLTVYDTTVFPGADYVIRALAYSEDNLGQPKLEVYDETNGATISSITAFGQQDNLVVNGGFDSGTGWSLGTGWAISGGSLSYSGAVGGAACEQDSRILSSRFYTVSISASNITAGGVLVYLGGGTNVKSITSDGVYSFVALSNSSSNSYFRLEASGAFRGNIDNVSCMLIPDEQHPEPLICSFELPTVARNGSAADCTSFSVRLLSATAGVVGFNQVELLPNLLDNPSFDTGTGDPYIPYGWTNNGLDAGDSVQESTVVHSSGKSLLYNTSVSGESLSFNVTHTIGKFFAHGGFTKGGSFSLGYPVGALQQASGLSNYVVSPISKFTESRRIWRATQSTGYVWLYGYAGEVILRYLDDFYSIALDDVSLTATPASLANSLEGSGIRVDGKDTLTQPIPAGILTATKGRIKFKFTPRHSSADVAKFGNATDSRIVSIASNDFSQYVIVKFTTANNLTLSVASAGGNIGGTSDITSVFVAGSTYTVEIVYSSSKLDVLVDGVSRCSASGLINFSLGLTSAYFGSSSSVALQSDAVFSPA